jgi:hypothetical protein
MFILIVSSFLGGYSCARVASCKHRACRPPRENARAAQPAGLFGRPGGPRDRSTAARRPNGLHDLLATHGVVVRSGLPICSGQSLGRQVGHARTRRPAAAASMRPAGKPLSRRAPLMPSVVPASAALSRRLGGQFSSISPKKPRGWRRSAGAPPWSDATPSGEECDSSESRTSRTPRTPSIRASNRGFSSARIGSAAVRVTSAPEDPRRK